MKIHNSMEARSLEELPKRGIDRYFVWLVKVNTKLSMDERLSDAELWDIAKAIRRKVK